MSVFGDVGSGNDWWGLLSQGIDLAAQAFGPQPQMPTGIFPPQQQLQQFQAPMSPIPGLPAAGALGLGAAALGLLQGGMTGGAEGQFDVSDLLGAPQLFRATDSRIRPKARIDAVGPDGRCYTWLRAVPYGFKVRGTRVGGKRRHHHHRKR